jgi:Flp pilus assembly protein TadG
MKRTVDQNSARNRQRRGNAILENVFTLMPTFALIFAFFDFGLMMFRWSTLQNSVREGVRYAITYQRKTGKNQDASIRDVVQSYGMGVINDPNTIFIDYYRYDSTANDYVKITGTAANTANQPGNVVEVSVRGLSYSWMAPLSGNFFSANALRSTTPLTLNVYSSDVMNGYPPGVTSVPR